MSAVPRKRRTGLWVGIALVVLVVALQVVPSFAGGGEPSEGPAGSSYSTGSDGTAAYAELLGRAGHEVQRLRRPLDEVFLDPGATTLVLLDPQPPLAEDVDALRQFVRSGGRLVAAGPGAAAWVRPLLDHPPTFQDTGDTLARAIVPVPEVSGARLVQSAGDVTFDRSGDLLPALAGDSGPLLGVADVGEGRVAVLADGSTLQNRLLAQADNAALGLSLVGEPGRTVVFAESVHGYGPASGLGAIPDDWVWALSGLVLAAIVLALSRARRLGPPERPDRELPPPRLAYAESLGRALSRTSDRGRAVDSLQDHGRRLLRRACGPGAPEHELRAAALRYGVPTEEVDALLDEEAGRRDPLAAGRAYARLAEAATRRRGEGGI
jgi:hypothetical protein